MEKDTLVTLQKNLLKDCMTIILEVINGLDKMALLL